MLRAGPVGSWELSSLGTHDSSWWLLGEMYKNHWSILQNLYFSFPRTILSVSQKLYSGSLRVHEGHCFVYSWIQSQKIIKSNLLGLVLLTSGAKAGKSSNRVSWDWFSPRLVPRLESHQIEHLGIGFDDFLSQCWKVIKSSLLGLVLSYRLTIPAQ